jgi:hypothetical protein
VPINAVKLRFKHLAFFVGLLAHRRLIDGCHAQQKKKPELMRPAAPRR